jgi:transmembrane sensor
MPMKRKAIYKQLVRRYLENKASDREKEVFFHLLAGGKLDKYLHSEMEAKAGRTLNAVPGSNQNTVTRSTQNTASGSRRSALTTLAIRYTAAATFTGLLALTGILWSRYHRRGQNSDHSTAATYYKNEVPPGGNHAILTLAGGLHVVLDSAGQGSLGMQGASRIVRLNSGSLFYKPISGNHASAYYNTITTPAGGQYQVTLADGTKVWLNALSTIKFPTSFDGTDRTVELTGEAYFEVSKDKSKPFHVKVNGMDVDVLGTRFNVNAYSDESTLKTTLLEGAVKLTRGNAALVLTPGQQGQTAATGGLSLVRDADADEAVAWKNGYFSFDDADIRTVMRQLSRWYGIRVRYEGSPTNALFWGKMGRDLNLTQVLSGLDKSKVHFQLEGTTLTVLP